MDKVCIRYKNYKGEIAWRNIEPKRIYFGYNDWHKEEQWLMIAYDLDKKAMRDFAMKDILVWGNEASKDCQEQTTRTELSIDTYKEARQKAQCTTFALLYGESEEKK